VKRLVVLLLAAAAVLVAGSRATGPPVGALPKGPLTTITTPSQGYVAIALNRGQSGLVWRLARAYDTRIVDQTTQTRLGDLTVWVFRTITPGTATLRFALTNGAHPHAYQAATYRLVVRPR
jgi:hypothetical protein